jgi:superfamily II DNA/RNA helicase
MINQQIEKYTFIGKTLKIINLIFLRIGRSGRFGRKGVAINFVKE